MKYHVLIGFPFGWQRPTGTEYLVYGEHAQRQAYVRGIELPRSIQWQGIVEVADPGTKDETVLLRLPYDERDDLCLVIIRRRGFVKTAYLNERSDTHETLDRSKYANS
jgi:hypothetical protein